jgi:N-acetylmuramoyl-L-alanine amidase
MTALEGLLAGVVARWRIRPERVIGHSDMAPDRKGDPGARFDWRRLARAGLSVWPGDAAVGATFDIDGFVRAARVFGYPPADPDTLLRAVRLRFRPWAAGPGDGADMAALADLARRFPVDGGGAGA